MKVSTTTAVLAIFFGAAALSAAPAAAQPVPLHVPTTAPYSTVGGAHARYSKAAINLGQPNLALTLAVVNAGGGAAAFDAKKLVTALSPDGPAAQLELAALTKKFGADRVAAFVKTFDFVIADSLTQIAKAGMVLPPAPQPDPADTSAVVAALVSAGSPPRGNFDIEYLLDSLISHPTHVLVMNDIDADPNLGPTADADYHRIFAQLLSDLKQPDKR